MKAFLFMLVSVKACLNSSVCLYECVTRSVTRTRFLARGWNCSQRVVVSRSLAAERKTNEEEHGVPERLF